MSVPPIIEFKSVQKRFGQKNVLSGLDLQICEGQFYSLVGESGSGKTTTLRLMNGLDQPSEGHVFYDGQQLDYKNIIPVRRTMGYCLQGYTLFPHLTVRENIAIVARKSGWNEEKIKARVAEVMDLLNLEPGLYLKKMPNQLSGGQRQRVGIARAIFMNPKILLMDEPFGALDPLTRNELQQAFIDLQKKLGLSVVLVTHDLSEAFKMSHQVMVLHQGRVAQQGKPNSLLTKPVNAYVKSFLKTNSPGHLLREVPVYSVLYSDVWLGLSGGHAETSDWARLQNCDTGEVRSFASEESATEFLKASEQRLTIQIDVELKFVSARELSTGIEVNKCLASDIDLLSALQELFHLKVNSLPVVDRSGHVIGIFGREALDVVG